VKLAQALMAQSKHGEAIDEENAIYPAVIAAVGEDNQLTMTLLEARAQSEGTLQRWDDSIRDDRQAHRIAVKKLGPLTFLAIGSLSDAGLSSCRMGRVDEGAADAREAYEGSRTAFGDRAALTGGTAYALASCLIGQRKLDEAAALLAGIDVRAVQESAVGSDWSADIALGQAEIVLLRGDVETARRLVETARPAYAHPDADPYQKHKLSSLEAAIEERAAATPAR
jgi:hypothetical protein